MLIILLAPVFGVTWVKLGARNPSRPPSSAWVWSCSRSGSCVMAWAPTGLAGGKVGMQWLVATYFFHTLGELCLSPVGLSSMTKLAPAGSSAR